MEAKPGQVFGEHERNLNGIAMNTKLSTLQIDKHKKIAEELWGGIVSD
jgi:hypothetical protein